MKITKNIILIFAMIIFILYIPTISNGALQANGKSTVTRTIDSWLYDVRKMEATGGTFGLNETINGTNLTSASEVSNNFDVHMQLNTEYGALALLSASAYGNPSKINSGDTTSGNETGVYIYLNNESTAAAMELEGSQRYVNANRKYKNVYTDSESSAKIGDATTQTKGWHNATANKWLSNNFHSTFTRSCGGSIFGYMTDGSDGGRYRGYSAASRVTRAVVVVGNGI